MTTDKGRRRRQAVAVVGLVALLGVIVAGTVVSFTHTGHGPAEISVEWGDGEGHPGCVYDEGSQTVEARLTIHGTAPQTQPVTVTVIAYADENTSDPVGSKAETVQVEGDVHEILTITVAVDRAPKVDEDGVAACRRTVDSASS